jgi:hypothetical protein
MTGEPDRTRRWLINAGGAAVMSNALVAPSHAQNAPAATQGPASRVAAAPRYGGRVVADAATRSVANVSVELLERGHARFYTGGRRDRRQYKSRPPKRDRQAPDP